MKSELKIPEVGQFVKGCGLVYEIQDVTPPPVERQIDFLVKQQESQLQIYANGNFVSGGGTFHNNGGEGSDITNAVESAKRLDKYYGGEVEIRVVQKTVFVRMRPDFPGENLHCRDTVTLKRLEHCCCRDLPYGTEIVEWSSKTGYRKIEGVSDGK